jgi:hypothetical protein
MHVTEPQEKPLGSRRCMLIVPAYSKTDVLNDLVFPYDVKDAAEAAKVEAL